MIERHAKRRILRSLAEAPAVALLGPRQVGKTTLARDIAADVPDCLYLDLENPGDAARLADPMRYLDAQAGRLVILDEIQRMPGLFQVLRGKSIRAVAKACAPGSSSCLVRLRMPCCGNRTNPWLDASFTMNFPD